jgi:ribosomal protein S18 acetylase RimI-like enzyme
MRQSSITTWLKKPASVTHSNAPKPSEPQLADSRTQGEEQIQSDHEHSSEQVSLKIPSQAQAPTVPASFSLPPLPPNVELVPLTEDHLPAFQRLNTLTLPVAYPPQFYKESMTEPYQSITLIALWHPKPHTDPPSAATEKPFLIGAIRCRLLPSSILYLSTLGLLSPYRTHGIATHLLQTIVTKASLEHGVKCVTAHVWEANEEAMEWYKKRGFETLGKEEGYYRKLKPSGAVLVRRWIGVGDFLNGTKVG